MGHLQISGLKQVDRRPSDGEGILRGDLSGGAPGTGVVMWAVQRVSRRSLPLILFEMDEEEGKAKMIS